MKKRTNNRGNRKENTYFSFNTYLIIYAIAILIFSALAVAFFMSGDAWGILFLLIALLAAFIALVSPLYFQFSYKSVTIVYVLGDRETIPWTSVRNITLYGSWIEHFGGFPYYQVAYGHKKQKFYINGEITKSRKNKKLIEKFYGGTIL